METKEIPKSDTQNDTDSFSMRFHPNKRDKTMLEVVQSYTNELQKWFEQDGIWHENQIQHASQGIWYSLYLEKKRLESRRCKMRYTTFKNVAREMFEDDQSYRYGKDGKYTSCSINRMTKTEKQYSRDGIVIGKEEQRLDLIYHILRSQNQYGDYICPNCGAEQDLDKLLDGCDYCNSKFDISAYEDKVVSVSTSQGRFDDRSMDGFKTYSTIIGVVLIVWGILIVFVIPGLGCFVSLPAIGYGIYQLSKGFKSKSANQTYDSWQQHLITRQKILETLPEFSEEEFIGSLDCKLKSIHYASSPQELTAFVKCDMASYVETYQDIINCETGKIAYKNIWADRDYYYIQLHRQIDVKKDGGRHLLNGTGFVAVTLAKKIDAKIRNEVSLYRCNCCGSTISLVEGGKCRYCDNEIDYASYDWIVVDYSHTNEL